MKKNLSSLVLILTFCIIGSSVYGQRSVVLKYNFKEGKIFRSTITVNTNIVKSMMGQEMNIRTDVASKAEIKFTKVDPKGNASALMSMLNISSKTVAMGQEKVENISDFKKDEISINMIFARSGKVLLIKIADTTASLISPEEYIINTKFFLLPGKSIRIGENWSVRQIDTMRKQISNPLTYLTTYTENKYTLAGKEIKDGKKLYKISYTGTIEIAGKGTQSGMDLLMEGTGQTVGFFYFDPSISMVIYSESETEMNNTTIAVNGQQNMTIPMRQKTKTVTTLEAL